MRYLLDTNVVSELRKPAAAVSVAAWVSARASVDLAISVITAWEIEIGVARLERRDRRQGAALRAWFEVQMLPSFEQRILPIDVDTARAAARLQIPDPRSTADSFIAATALRHGLVLVTRNVTDFRGAGVEVVDPWVTSPTP